MIPIITFETVWNFVVHMFTTWLPWAQNWMVSLTTVDWQTFTEIVHDQWVVDVAGTGLEWIVIWQFVEAVFSTIGATIGLFVWWLFAHLIWPWLSFFVLGIMVPAGTLSGYLMYLAVIYIIGPFVFVEITNKLSKKDWRRKVLYLGIWSIYIYLLFAQTPEIILIHPGWYLLITVLIAIYQDDK